jgi:hypothetical protein
MMPSVRKLFENGVLEVQSRFQSSVVNARLDWMFPRYK